MRLFVFNHQKKFRKLLVPYIIEPDLNNGLILYVHDHFGRIHVLTFADREHLRSTLFDLKSVGIASAECEIEYIDVYEHSRELQFNEEMEFDYVSR